MGMDLEIALGEIRQERERQDRKWGVQEHSLAVWLMILAEEFGEAAREINEVHFRTGSIRNTREELIQTAAVAVAMVEYIDRHPELKDKEELLRRAIER